MRIRVALPAAVTVLAALLVGCGGDDEAARSYSSQVDPDDDPADPAGETGETDGETDGETGTGVDPSAVAGLDCSADIEVSGDVTGTLEGGTSITSNTDGPSAYYQILGEDILLSVYSDGEGIDPTVILQSASGAFNSAPGADGLDIAEDGSGATLDVDVELVPSADRTAHVAGTIEC